MDTLHTVLRSIRSESKARRDHLSVFREFLDHLDRITRSRKGGVRPKMKASGRGRRSGKA